LGDRKGIQSVKTVDGDDMTGALHVLEFLLLPSSLVTVKLGMV